MVPVSTFEPHVAWNPRVRDWRTWLHFRFRERHGRVHIPLNKGSPDAKQFVRYQSRHQRLLYDVYHVSAYGAWKDTCGTPYRGAKIRRSITFVAFVILYFVTFLLSALDNQLLLRDVGAGSYVLSSLRDVGLLVRMWLHMDDDDDRVRQIQCYR